MTSHCRCARWFFHTAATTTTITIIIIIITRIRLPSRRDWRRHREDNRILITCMTMAMANAMVNYYRCAAANKKKTNNRPAMDPKGTLMGDGEITMTCRMCHQQHNIGKSTLKRGESNRKFLVFE